MATSRRLLNVLLGVNLGLLRLYEQNVEPARDEAALQFVLRLHQRYVSWQGRNPAIKRTFIQWLAHARLLERTFEYMGDGNGDVVRRRWALKDVRAFDIPPLAMVTKPSQDWITEKVFEVLNRRFYDPKWLVIVEFEQVPAIPTARMTEGRSMRFLRVQRPPQESAAS